MSNQTSYDLRTGEAYAGLLIGAGNQNDITSRSVETASIPFGRFVKQGTGDNQALLGSASADLLGVSVRSIEREGALNSGDVEYKVTEAAGILRRGYIWVQVTNGCVAGDDVISVDVDGTVKSGTAGGGETQVANARFESSAAVNGFAKLYINLAP